VKPTLFTLPAGLGPVYTYYVALLAGFTLAIWLARREEDRSGRDGVRIVDLGILMLIFGVIGARLLSVLADGHFMDFVHLCTDPKQVVPADAWARGIVCDTDQMCSPHYLCDTVRHACYPPQDCLEALKFWHGGLAYYGGFLLAVPVGLWYARRKQLGVWRVADLTSPYIALGLFFGRVGCFFNGCCYGKPSDLPWALHFPGVAGKVHPTQLYEAIGSLVVFALLYFVVRPRKRAHGQVFAALLVAYGVLRFVLEFFRNDERGEVAALSTSQWISVPLVLGGILLYRWLQRRSTTSADAPSPS
jgi:phosphatidylglycerol:prolipoprotein diacylglycerol transferase